MKRSVIPAKEVGWPEPPPGHFWRVKVALTGIDDDRPGVLQVELRKRSKFWSYRVDHRFAIETQVLEAMGQMLDALLDFHSAVAIQGDYVRSDGR